MVDNLTIQIGADSTKLRADLLLAQADIRKFASETNKNVRVGDREAAAASALGGAQAIEQAVALKAAVAGTNVEARTLATHFRDGARELEHIRGQFRGGFEGLLGNVPLSGKALGIGLGLAALGELGKVVGETAEKAHRMEAVSEALGVSTGQMRDWTKAAGAAHVPADIFDRAMEKLAISTEKAANEQRKLRVETAQLIAKDSSFGIVARGGLSTPPPKLSSQLVDNMLAPSLPGQGAQIHDDETAQNRLELRAAKFREFAKSELETFKQSQELFAAAGQSVPPLPSLDSFAQNLRSRMAQPTPEGEALRTKFAQQGGDAPARDFSEMLKRLEPSFKDAFTKHNIALIDAAGEVRNFAKTLVETAIAMSKMSEGEFLSFGKETMGGREFVRNPELGQFIRQQGALGGGILKDAAVRPDKDIGGLSDVAKTWQSTKAAIEDAGFSIGGAVVRGITDAKGITESLKETRTETLNLGSALDQLGNEPGITTAIGDTKRLQDEMRDLARQARSAAAAVGAALGGGGNPFSDTGEDIPRFADGGLFSGRPGRDTNLAWMTDGEYVINRDSARRIGLGTLNAMNFGRHLPRYADGGPVGSISSGGSLGTINVTFDGQTHSLRADRQNFDGFVQHARERRLAQILPRPANAT